jgi:hypothetical protein
VIVTRRRSCQNSREPSWAQSSRPPAHPAGQPFFSAGPHLPDCRLPWWALAIGLALTEVGLFCATAVDVLAGWLLGFAIVVVVERRHIPLKVGFDLALATASTAVAVAVFHVFVGSRAATSWSSGWGPAPQPWPSTLSVTSRSAW